jgi:hypothetical protein
MKLNWGWFVAILYCSFAAMIVTMAVRAGNERFDLVSNDYYGEELAYQKVIDAGKNQSELSAPLVIHTNEKYVLISFPKEFKNKVLTGDLLFYSPVNSSWDKDFKISQNSDLVNIERSFLRKTKYTLKVSWEADGKKYYQETDVALN